jgi:acetyl-CoA acyltransferase
MPEAWIVEAVRTPIGKHGGALASVRPDDLLAHALFALMERFGIPKEEVEDVYAGCANQAGEDNRNVARMALLLAGFPVEVAGCTVNRLCGSGLEAVAQAVRAIWAGEGQVYIGSGVESMSRAPYAVPKPEKGFPTGNLVMYDTTLGWRFVNPRMQALYGTESMGETAENLAEMYGIGREEQDRFALLSHQKAVRAWDEGRFRDEVVPVPVRRGKEEAQVEVDEGPSPWATPWGPRGPGSSPPWSTRCGGEGSSSASPPCASGWARASPWWWRPFRRSLGLLRERGVHSLLCIYS